MADNNSGGTTFLAVIVGGLLVLVVGFFVLGGFPGQKASGPSVTITAPGKS